MPPRCRLRRRGAGHGEEAQGEGEDEEDEDEGDGIVHWNLRRSSAGAPARPHILKET